MPRIAGSIPLLVVRILITFHLIAIAWVFFRASSVNEAILILQKIGPRIPELVALIPRYPFTAEHYFGFAMIGFLVVVEIFDERRSIFERLKAAPVWLRWSIWYLAIFALLILGRWQAKEFIYMQF